MEMSRIGAECVNAPLDTKSTPISRMRAKKFYIRCLMFAVSGILAGIFFAVKGGLSGIEKPNVFSNDYLHEYACLAIDSKKLFWIVVKERGKWFFLLWAFGLTGAGVWASGIFPALWGFFGSVFFAQAFLKRQFFGYCG